MKDIEKHLLVLAQYAVDFVVIGGVAATLHGSSHITQDLDVCYSREKANLERLANALNSVNVRLRGVPDDIAFLLDAETLKRGQKSMLPRHSIAQLRGGGFIYQPQ